jgi:hypothetical protein
VPVVEELALPVDDQDEAEHQEEPAARAAGRRLLRRELEVFAAGRPRGQAAPRSPRGGDQPRAQRGGNGASPGRVPVTAQL